MNMFDALFKDEETPEDLMQLLRETKEEREARQLEGRFKQHLTSILVEYPQQSEKSATSCAMVIARHTRQ